MSNQKVASTIRTPYLLRSGALSLKPAMSRWCRGGRADGRDVLNEVGHLEGQVAHAEPLEVDQANPRAVPQHVVDLAVALGDDRVADLVDAERRVGVPPSGGGEGAGTTSGRSVRVCSLSIHSTLLRKKAPGCQKRNGVVGGTGTAKSIR